MRFPHHTSKENVPSGANPVSDVKKKRVEGSIKRGRKRKLGKMEGSKKNELELQNFVLARDFA